MKGVSKNFLELLTKERRRLTITINAIVVVILAGRIPLPGLDESHFGQHFQSHFFALTYVSQKIWEMIFSFGALAYLGFKAWGFSNLQVAPAPFARWLIGIVLIFSLFYGYNIAPFLIDLNVSSDHQAVQFVDIMTVTISLAAGTAIYLFFGRLIETSGLGNGFWVLTAVYYLKLWLFKLSRLPILIRNHGISMHLIAVELLGYLAIAVVLIWVFTFRLKNKAQLSSTLFIPWLIAPLMASFFLEMVIYFNIPIVADYILGNFGFIPDGLELLLVAVLAWVYFADDRSSAVRIFSVAGYAVAAVIHVVLFYYHLTAAPISTLLLVLVAFAAVSIFEEIKPRSYSVLKTAHVRSKNLN